MTDQNVTLEAIRGIVKEEMQPLRDEIVVWKDEVLTSNDGLAKKLDTLLTEKAATSAQLDRHDKKIGNLDSFARNVSMKTEIKFQTIE